MYLVINIFLLSKKIFNSFLEVGHTQSEGDSMHALIENHVKRKSIYTQKEWIQNIKECKKVKPYEVYEVSQSDIFNVEALSTTFFNWKAAKVSTLREIHVTPKSSEVSVKHNYFDDYTKIKVLKKNKKIEDIMSYELKLAYTQRIPLSEKKLKDLNSMLEKNLIPKDHISDFSEVLNI